MSPIKVAIRLGAVLIFAALGGCSTFSKEPTPSVYQQIDTAALSPEENQELLGEVARSWFYGQGLGSTTLQVGTAVAFPPYALVLIGNTALSLSGYQQVGVSEILPEEGASAWSEFYDAITSVPGRITAALSGEEYRSTEVTENNLSKFALPKSYRTVTAANYPYGYLPD